MTAADQVWRLLPDYAREADTTGTLRAFTAAAAVGLSRSASFLDLVDPDTSVTGTCELANPLAAPRAYLPWLGWLLGIDTAALPAADVRPALVTAASTQRRGSSGAIRSAVRRTLTGGRSCRVYRDEDGAHPYTLRVVTVTDQTPDPAASLAAALTEKPAGMGLSLDVVTGATWNELAAAFTWDGVRTTFATWDDVAAWIPEG